MRPGKVRSLKGDAWLLAVALVLLQVAFVAGPPAAGGQDGVATFSSARWSGDAELIGGSQQVPFFRAAKRPHLGLRSKTPPKGDVIAREAARSVRPISLTRQITPSRAPSELPRSSLLQRTQNPRAPPADTILTT
jgi:hypothetical protein